MHISRLQYAPALVAVQFMPPRALGVADRAINRLAIQSREFGRLLRAAKRKARADFRAYEAEQARLAREIEGDITW